MSEPTSTDIGDLRAIARTIRIPFAVLVVGFSYINIHCALGIPKFRQIFSDMLGPTPLPAATQFALQYQQPLEAISLAVPCVAIGLIFYGRLAFSLAALGFLLLLVLLQIGFVWFALTEPLTTIIFKMQGAAGA